MFYQANCPIFHPQTRIFLNAELTHAAQDPALKPLLHGGGPALLQRYTRCYERISRMPRKLRRRLQRQWKRSLAGVALLMALGQAPTLAATINVNTTNPNIVSEGRCSLIEAIENANDNVTGNVHSDCTKGDPAGSDVIKLPLNSKHTLTAVNNTSYDGDTFGLPIITSTITIEGRGSTITRKSNAPAFRIFAIAHGNLTLNETTVSGSSGSGIVMDGGILNLNNSTISGNKGSGISSDGGDLTLNNSTISNNTGVGIFNGGSYENSYSNLVLNNSTISGNSTRGYGGGIFNGIYGDVIITNSTISGNTAERGGGGIFNSYDSLLILNNSTVSGNSTGGRGGGIYNTVYNNTVILNRTLLSGNSASTGADVFSASSSSIQVNNFNLFGHSGNSGVVGFTPGPTDLVPSVALAEILSPLASNGGPTLTHALPPGSPGVDAILIGTPCEALDQRGVPRPQDGDNDGNVACDIGAFELESIPKFIYGVQDTDASKSQLFTIDKITLTVSRLGPGRNGRDIEGLDIHPTTQVIYGAAGSANTFRQKGFLFSIDKVSGALTPIGPTGFKSIEALSFRPTDASLWGWAEDKGLVKISLVNGAATLVLASDKNIEGLAWNNSGQVIYAAAGRNLFRYSPATNQLSQIAANLPSPAEALEMRPDGLLAVGVDGATSIKAYDPIAKKPVPAEDIPSGFNDVEGIAWPADAL